MKCATLLKEFVVYSLVALFILFPIRTFADVTYSTSPSGFYVGPEPLITITSTGGEFQDCGYIYAGNEVNYFTDEIWTVSGATHDYQLAPGSLNVSQVFVSTWDHDIGNTDCTLDGQSVNYSSWTFEDDIQGMVLFSTFPLVSSTSSGTTTATTTVSQVNIENLIFYAIIVFLLTLSGVIWMFRFFTR